MIERLTVGQAAIENIEPLKLTDRLSSVLERFAGSENFAYPVVNQTGKLAGMLTLSHLREILLESECWDWMVTADVMVSDMESVSDSTPLKEAFGVMRDSGMEQLPVVTASNGKSAGMLDMRHARKIVQQEMIKLQA